MSNIHSSAYNGYDILQTREISHRDKKMKQRILIRLNQKIAFGLVIIGLSLVLFSFFKQYELSVNGVPVLIKTFALTPKQLIQNVGYSLMPEDLVVPERNKLLIGYSDVVFEQAKAIQIVVNDESVSLVTSERIPGNILRQVGIEVYSGDYLLWNGKKVSLTEPLPISDALILQFVPARSLTIEIDDIEEVIFSDFRTIGEALSQNNISLAAGDWISHPLETPLDEIGKFIIRRGKPVVISIGDQYISGISASETVGQALQKLGISLQNLDFSIPTEEQPIPINGRIKIVRVQEQVVLTKEETEYTLSYQEDPNTELDTTAILKQGQPGLVVTRSRIRLESGKQVDSLSEGPWKASDPIDGIVGIGLNPVVHTETINGDIVEYWRKLSVYATSYKPSSQGGHTGTASGTPLTKGIIAVTVDWYRSMKFQQVYVPGYGFGMIADTGGGIPGRYWIDLGFDDSNYESWHYWTTMYLLAPVPDYFPLYLP